MNKKKCQKCAAAFEITAEDTKYCQKFEVPQPSFCPDCRQQRRLTFRNDRNYYTRKCDLCEAQIISIYSNEKPFPVYCRDCFWSDRYDPLAYGRDFDLKKPFFEQFEEMRSKVPRIAIFNTQSENADYTVHSSKNRNCYMSSSLVECEDAFYSDWLFYSKDCIDIYLSQNLERCYFSTDCDKCYASSYLENCLNVSFSYLCFDCRSSENLICCVGLRSKKLMILNKKTSEADFNKTLHRLNTEPKFRDDFQKQYEALRLTVPVKYFWDKNSENCSGDHIANSRNTHYSYNVKDIEDGRYIYESGDIKDAMDVTRVGHGEMLYEVKGAVDLKLSKFCNLCYQSSNLEYCDNCQSSHDSFGCMSLKNNRYCILNKQYSSQEYAALVERIKDHMKKPSGAASTCEYGEFFPSTISPYGYNETKAQDFFPLTKRQALASGYKWKDPDPKNYSPQTCEVHDDIKNVPDGISREILACAACGKNYKIIPQELRFYRKENLPIPKKCPDCRHKVRMALQNPRRLWPGICMCQNDGHGHIGRCAVRFQTTYSPQRPEQVYCDACYLAVVY